VKPIESSLGVSLHLPRTASYGSVQIAAATMNSVKDLQARNTDQTIAILFLPV